MVNYAEGTPSAIVAALAEAAQELAAVDAEVGQLQAHLHERQERATQLQQFIAVGQHLCGDAPPRPSSSGRSADEPPGAARCSQPLTTVIVESVATAGRPLRPPEVRTVLARLGKPATRAVVASTLSTLVKQQRLTRPAPGQYTALRRQGSHDMHRGTAAPAALAVGPCTPVALTPWRSSMPALSHG
jgi:hypothetical protein